MSFSKTPDRILSFPIALTYHRITSNPQKALSPLGLEIGVTVFKRQLVQLLQEFDVVNPLRLLERRSLNGHSRPQAVLTFDDGTVDFFRVAAPILSEQNLPAIVCVNTDTVEKGEVFWWDSLYWIMYSNLGKCLGYPATISKSVFFSDKKELDTAFPSLVEEAKRYNHMALLSWIESELRLTPIPDELVNRNRSMTWDEIIALDRDLFTVASHGIDHAILSCLDSTEAERQILLSRQIIQHKIGIEPAFYVYPNGGPGDYRSRDIKLVSKAGYTGALTVSPPPFTKNEILGLESFVIPRVTVGQDPAFTSKKTLYNRASQRLPFQSLINAGNHFSKHEPTQEGINCLKRAAQSEDKKNHANLYLARQLLELGDLSEAQKTITDALVKNPENRDIQLLYKAFELSSIWHTNKRINRTPRVILAASGFSKGGGPMVAMALAKYFATFANVELVSTNYDSWEAVNQEIPKRHILETENFIKYVANTGANGVIVFNCSSVWGLLRAMGVPTVEWAVHGANFPSGHGVCLNPNPTKSGDCIPDPIDIESIQAAPRKRIWNDNRFVLGIATRLSYIKNLTFLVEGVARLQQEGHPETSLVLLGADTPCHDGGGCHTLDELRELARTKLMDNTYIIFESEEAYPYIKGFDLAVCTSHSEGMPLFLLEAAVAGIPYVSSDVGYIRHYGENGRCGVVYPSKNLDAFTAEVSALMNDPNRLHEMGRYARHKVIRDNSLETVGKKFVDRLITQGFGQRKAI